MSPKTSQLQIRVSPEQKRALKRLAASAGRSVSEYVLEAALPGTHDEVADLVEALGPLDGRPRALTDLRLYLRRLDPEALVEALEGVDVVGLPPVLQNYVAATVEEVVAEAAVAVPGWVGEVAPLEKPHFSWDLRSLRPYLMRITPPAFKRRNTFVDARNRERRTKPGQVR